MELMELMTDRPPSPAAQCSARLARLTFITVITVITSITSIPSAAALEIEHSEAHYVGKHYEFELRATLDAPIDRVQRALRDYESYPALDRRILSASVLERSADVVVLATSLRVCFGVFCRTVKRVENVLEAPHYLVAIADPSRSDVRYGETRAQLLSLEDGRTRLLYTTSIEPAFWVPRFVGRRWMLATLREATTELFANLERKARE
jgi:hypothetical protein